MLGFLLRLLERAPNQRIQPALLDDENLRATCRTLQALGALRRLRTTGEILCPSCFEHRVQPCRGSTGEMAHCPDCGPTVFAPGYSDVMEVHGSWLLDQIAANFPVTSKPRPEELEPDLLWRVLRLRHLGQQVDILFARIPGHSDQEDRIARALVDQSPGLLQLVLLSRSSALRRLEQPGRRIIVAIEDHAHFGDVGLRLDCQALLDRLAIEPPKPVAKVQVAPDGAWLRVNGRELRLRQGKQRDFALLMAEAYGKGNRRPKLEWALRNAGYAEGSSELKHITKRPEFFEFFDYGNGEVWIRDDR